MLARLLCVWHRFAFSFLTFLAGELYNKRYIIASRFCALYWQGVSFVNIIRSENVYCPDIEG